MIKFICDDDVIVFINIDFFKENIILQNANVFNRLFGINNDNLFGNFPLLKNDKDEKLLLKNLNINSASWYQLISYLKNGYPPYYSRDVFKDVMKRNFFIENLENLNQTCNKLGGIPKFDEFYNKFYESLEDELSNFNNPFEPLEDTQNKYQWGLAKEYNGSFIPCYANYPTNEGWSVTKQFKFEDEIYMWFRKKII